MGGVGVGNGDIGVVEHGIRVGNGKGNWRC